jgi:predicted ATPase
VELASVRDVAGVVGAVAEMFRFTGRRGNRSRTLCSRCWPQKQTLLVVDNCEHVLGSVARS